MARVEFIEQGDARSGRKYVDLESHRYTGLLLLLDGTSTATPSLEDVGRVRVERHGRQVQGQDFAFYADWTDLIGGYPEQVLPTGGGDTTMTALIPFSYPGLASTMDVRSDEEVNVHLQFEGAALTAGFSSLRYTLLGILDPATPEVYELNVSQQDIQVAGQGREEEELNGSNIGSVLLRDSGDVVDEIALSVDDRQAVDNITLAHLNAISNIETRTEGAANPLTLINFVSSGDLSDASNAKVRLTGYFSEAGTLGVTTMRVQALSQAALRRNRRRAARWRQSRPGIAAQYRGRKRADNVRAAFDGRNHGGIETGAPVGSTSVGNMVRN